MLVQFPSIAATCRHVHRLPNATHAYELSLNEHLPLHMCMVNLANGMYYTALPRAGPTSMLTCRALACTCTCCVAPWRSCTSESLLGSTSIYSIAAKHEHLTFHICASIFGGSVVARAIHSGVCLPAQQGWPVPYMLHN